MAESGSTGRYVGKKAYGILAFISWGLGDEDRGLTAQLYKTGRVGDGPQSIGRTRFY